jgi:Flp pilus assembly protein protease CpaA
MIEIFAAVAALLITGVAFGVLAVISLAIRREDRELTLTTGTASRAGRGTRRLTGVSARQPGIIHEVSLSRRAQSPLPLSAREGMW